MENNIDKKEKNIMELADYVVDEITNQGAEEGQVFVTTNTTTLFKLEQGEYKTCSTEFGEDINILLFKNKKKGSYFINKANKEDAYTAVKMAIDATNAADADEANGIAPNQGYIESRKGVYTPDLELLFNRMEEFRSDVEKRHPLIMIYEVKAYFSNRHMVYKNTNGTICDEYAGSYDIGIEIAGHKDDKTTSLDYAYITLSSLDKPIIECGDIEKTLCIMEQQLEAQALEGKFTGTVLMNTGVLGEFVGYLSSISSGNSCILDGTSVWRDKIGEKVTDERLSIGIDPSDPRVVRGESISYDGFKSEGYHYIQNGVLKNFTIDYYTAKKTGQKMAANGGFYLIIGEGDVSYEEMIEKIDHGLIVNGFSGGMPAANGDFSGVAKNSFRIEHGKITGAVTEAMISGNLYDMFANIRDISKERTCTGWNVIPYISFDGITISGK